MASKQIITYVDEEFILLDKYPYYEWRGLKDRAQANPHHD